MDMESTKTYFAVPLRDTSKLKPLMNLNPYERHKLLVKHYHQAHPTPQKITSELDILKRNHKFLREGDAESWEDRIAQKYYDKLFKEYCLGDFSRYKTGQVGLRWRTKQECVTGKGHFKCGNLKCEKDEGLYSWEVHFGYMEDGVKKEALVKIRLCPKCSKKLHYRKLRDQKKMLKVEKKAKKREAKERKKRGGGADVSGDDASESEGDLKREESDDDEAAKASKIWSKPVEVNQDEPKTQEEEMDDFFKDLLM